VRHFFINAQRWLQQKATVTVTTAAAGVQILHVMPDAAPRAAADDSCPTNFKIKPKYGFIYKI
jgi:hypothetical protein